jgi:hypothetical protein
LTTGVDVPIRNVVFQVRAFVDCVLSDSRARHAPHPQRQVMFRSWSPTQPSVSKLLTSQQKTRSREPHPEAHAIEVEGTEVAAPQVIPS